MGLLRFNYRSQSLDRHVDITIAYPTDVLSYYEEKAGTIGSGGLPVTNPRKVYTPGMRFQTVYLIHGGGDDDTLTYRYTNAERYAQANCVMLVTANIANSFGVDTAYGVKYHRFMTEELPVIVRSLFASSPRREDTFVVGYAMGGNAALGLALTRPDLYCHCIDLSGGIGMTLNTETLRKELEDERFRTYFELYTKTFGDPASFPGSRFDLYAAVEKNQKAGVALPAIDIVCGSDEFIRERVEDDVRLLRELGCPVTYHCPEGYRHDFTLWDTYLELAFNELLPLKRAPIYPAPGGGENA